jgi:hypothetical protein
MNDSTFDYLQEFYGPTRLWFSIIAAIFASFAMLSEVFFISFILSSKSLRTIRANWFLVGLSCSDFLHCSSMLYAAHATYYGSVDNRQNCARAGFFTLGTATCSFGFPPMIAAERFYKISEIPDASGRQSIGSKIFSVHVDRLASMVRVDGRVLFLLRFTDNCDLLSSLGEVVEAASNEQQSGFCEIHTRVDESDENIHIAAGRAGNACRGNDRRAINFAKNAHVVHTSSDSTVLHIGLHHSLAHYCTTETVSKSFSFPRVQGKEKRGAAIGNEKNFQPFLCATWREMTSSTYLISNFYSHHQGRF